MSKSQWESQQHALLFALEQAVAMASDRYKSIQARGSVTFNGNVYEIKHAFVTRRGKDTVAAYYKLNGKMVTRQRMYESLGRTA
jgi:predicted HAD superfamily phosphohydrolase